MNKRMSFYAISTLSIVPPEIRRILEERLEVKDIFGTRCYVMIEDVDKSPLNLLDEENHRKVERWLETVGADSIFSYSWG